MEMLGQRHQQFCKVTEMAAPLFFLMPVRSKFIYEATRLFPILLVVVVVVSTDNVNSVLIQKWFAFQ